ncbi:hypothetical protein AHF37_04823 [Paragonimus kellicotti]|nr:hypothetical protein AHF37_04823 [Paragonimus kellicotti]
MSSERFTSTVDIWINKPHVVNRKIFGATVSRAPDGVHWNRVVIPRSQTNFPNFSEQIVQSDSQFHFTSDYLSYILQLDEQFLRKFYTITRRACYRSIGSRLNFLANSIGGFHRAANP